MIKAFIIVAIVLALLGGLAWYLMSSRAAPAGQVARAPVTPESSGGMTGETGSDA